MQRRRSSFVVLIVVTLALGLMQGCATLEQMAAVISDLARLEFRLAEVRDLSLIGISLGGKSRLTDINVKDSLRLVQAFAAKRMPAEFVLDVEVVNPNDGSGGSTRTVCTLTSLESRLLIDDAPTITGNIDRAIDIPGTGQASIVPIRMSIDLYDFFGGKGYEGLVNLALALGGARRDPTRVALDAQPRVTTPWGPIVYPGRLTIVNCEFR